MKEIKGFSTTREQETRYIQWVAECRYARLEVPGRSGVVPLIAGGLTVITGPVCASLGFAELTLPFIVSGLILLLLGAFRAGAHRGRSLATGPEDEWACYRTAEGLVPRLMEDESLLGVTPATAPIRNGVRRVMAGLQVVWGIVLAGLPIATVAVAGENVGDRQFWISLFTVVGWVVVARGVRDGFFLNPVSHWAMTTRRLVAMAGPGQARSLFFEYLVHVPLVVPRSEDKATFALELRRLVSAGMLPMRGLWGVDEMERSRAEEWAKVVMAARRSV